MKFYLYDDNGLFQEYVEADADKQPQNSTSMSFLTMQLNTVPKWTGSTWIESGIPLKSYPATKEPTALQKLLMQQSQQITLLQSMAMQQNQSNVKLQATNVQQTTQIKQLQQMFMLANQQQAVEKSKEVKAQ